MQNDENITKKAGDSVPHPGSSRQAPPRGELALIELFRQSAQTLVRTGIRTGIGDDCAVLRVGRGKEVVVTTDFSLEGRHFRRDWHTPQSIGHRALARGLSDIAAMGARPLAAFLSLALPRALAADTVWTHAFMQGFTTLAKRFAVPLAGGDTAESPQDAVLIDIVLLGTVPAGKALLRSGARAGDAIYCTGSLGGAAAELQRVQRHQPQSKIVRPLVAPLDSSHPHFFSEPRLRQGAALLRRKLARAAIDISDGLSTDLAHLCRASGVSAVVNAEKLPLHPLALALPPDAAREAALHGGEDYELLFTASQGTPVPRRLAGVPVTRIGTIGRRKAGHPDVMLCEAGGRLVPLIPGGWEHFRS